MNRMALDTLKLADKLEMIGYSKEEAQKQARVQAEIVDMVFDQKVVTKHDLDQVENKLVNKIADVDIKLSSEIKDVHNRMDKVEIKIDHFQSEVKTIEENVVNKLFVRMTTATIGIVGMGFTVSLFLLKQWLS